YPDVQRLRQRPDSPGVFGGDHIGAAQPADQARGGIGGQPKGGGRQQQSTGTHSAQPTIASVTVTATESQSAARSVPVISPGPLMPVADFGPVDRLNGWAMTAVIMSLAAMTRFLNLRSPTDAGTPIFDEKHYAPQAWQMLFNHGVEDNPGYGLVVHPPVGKQL